MHKEQATLINAQSHLYEGTRQNMHVTLHKNADQTFLHFLLFMCFWIFDIKQVKIDKKEQIFKAFKNNKIVKTC